MLTYGFYNSKDHDRVYDAVQVSSIFDGIIEDGVYSNVGEFLAVVPNNGMTVTVKTGRAWFNHTWTLNDAWLPLTAEDPDPLLNRIDAVVLEVDTRVEKRENSIKIVTGTPSANGAKPKLTNEGGVYQHALAYITTKPSVMTIGAEDIEIVVGKSETPFVQAPLKTVSIEDLWQQWDAEFTEWFENLQATMTDNVVANLQYQIDGRVKIADKATDEDVKNGTANKWVDAKTISPLVPKLGSIVSEDDPDISAHPENYIKMDGKLIDASALPDNLKKKYINLIPNMVGVPDIKWNASSNRSACFSESVTIGEFDYIFSQGKIHKLRRSDNSVVDSSPNINNTVRYGVFGEYIVVWVYPTNTGVVYDKNLVKVRDILFLGVTNSYFYVIGMYQIQSGRIIVCGYSGSSSDPLYYYPAIYYTDNMFINITRASFETISSSALFNPYGSQIATGLPITVPFGVPGSLIHKGNSNRLFIVSPQFNTYVSGAYVPLYYSDDYGGTWTNVNLTNLLPSLRPATDGGLVIASIGYQNEIIVVVASFPAGSGYPYEIRWVSINCSTLSIGEIIIPPWKIVAYTPINANSFLIGYQNKRAFTIVQKEDTPAIAIATMPNDLSYNNYPWTFYSVGEMIDIDTGVITPAKLTNSLYSKEVTNSTKITLSSQIMYANGYIIYSLFEMPYGHTNGDVTPYGRKVDVTYTTQRIPRSFIIINSRYTDEIAGELYSGYLNVGSINYSSYMMCIPANDRIYIYCNVYTTDQANSYTNNIALYIDLSKRALPPTDEYIKIQ